MATFGSAWGRDNAVVPRSHEDAKTRRNLTRGLAVADPPDDQRPLVQPIDLRVGVRRDQRDRLEPAALLPPAPRDPRPPAAVQPRHGEAVVRSGRAERIERLE